MDSHVLLGTSKRVVARASYMDRGGCARSRGSYTSQRSPSHRSPTFTCAGRTGLSPWHLRRCAEQQPLLRKELGPLDDGFGAAARTQDELLQAGFFPEMGEVIEEVLQPVLHTRIGRRALSLFHGAGQCRGAGLETVRNDSEFLQWAAEAVRMGRVSVPATLVTGFMDATPGGTSLIRELLREEGSHIIVDFPPDPTAPECVDPGVEFSAPFLQHLGIPVSPPTGSGDPTEIKLFHASGDRGESGAIAKKIRILIDDGVPPESIGVVTRTEERLGWYIRLAFDELGIPWSGSRFPTESIPFTESFVA